MSEQQTEKHPHQLLDRPFPLPNDPPLNHSTGIDKELPCSSPSCPNFCSPKCGFCEFHCKKFHNGIHYEKGLRADIPDGIKNFLDLKKGSTLEWKMDWEDGNKVVTVKKKEN